MKLSQILATRDRLTQLDHDFRQKIKFADVEQETKTFVLNSTVIRDSFEASIQRNLHHLNNTVNNFAGALQDIRTWLDRTQISLDEEYLAAGDRLYATISTIALVPRSHPLLPWQSDAANTVLDRRLVLDEATNEAVFDRIRSMSEWKHTGMLVRPAKEPFVDTMVHLDPLYLVDNGLEMLEPARARYPEQYQRRLRYYAVEDQDPAPLASLPDGQFGCSVIYYFFNFKSLSVIKRYLSDLWNKTRPGGIVAFTLNDCDYAHNAALFEQNYACFTPGRMVREFVIGLGFEISYELHTKGELHWFELKKPGSKPSLRGGQALAEIQKIH